MLSEKEETIRRQMGLKEVVGNGKMNTSSVTVLEKAETEK